jgi:general stress protein CsbA
MLNFLKNPVLAIPIAGLLLLFAYAKPYGQNFEVLLIDMVSFFKRKKEIGVVVADDKKKDKEKDKDKKGKEKEKEKEIPKVTDTNTYTSTDIAINSNTTIPTASPIVNTSDIESVTVKDPRESFTVIKSNLLHYIVPKHKDFDLEVTDNELVVVTGSSTIHIPSSSSKVKLLIEIDNREIVRIVVNEQS